MTEHKKQKKADITVEVPIDGAQARLEGTTLYIKGDKGEVSRNFANPRITISVNSEKVVLVAKKATKRENKILRSFVSHVKNMVKGAKEGVSYKLKICSGHFPMNITVSSGELIIKNFLGEKVPRKLKLKEGANVKLDGSFINVEGADLELVSQVAADIEKATRRAGFDKRVFQDGIYIINKDGKDIK